MSDYHSLMNDTDAYDDYGNDGGGDPRIYHNDPALSWHPELAKEYDERTYLLTSRRFPGGQLVHRYYSLPDCACQVVQLINPLTTKLETAYALPSELTPA